MTTQDPVLAIPLAEIITGAYHAANCEDPDTCPNTCTGRMSVHTAVAVTTAVRDKMFAIIDSV